MTVLQEMKIASPELRGASLEVGKCRDMEVCLDGPAGTGKTFAALFKIHMMLLCYPGSKALIARKTNTALASTALATYREMIHPSENIRYFGGNKIRPAAFEYPNGSLLIVTGLDKPEKVKSLEIDLCFLNEATECEIEDLEFVRSRLRNGKTPYQQIIMDVNPDAPTHWLNQRMNEGTTTRLLSRHEDNPRFYNIATQEWTEEGHRYIFETLEGLTGVRLARLRYGMWSAAEGAVYSDSWDRKRNVIDRFPIPKEWPRYMAVDFGFVHPFVCLWAAQDPDGRLIIYRQIYQTKRLVEDHAKQIKHYSRWGQDGGDPLPREIITDHDAEDKATLDRHLGLHSMPAHKNVSAGIQAVASRFKAQADGKPRIMIFRDSLVERDRELAQMKRPTCLEDEPDSYVWDTRQGLKRGEAPVKESDDGCLVAGTLIRTASGDTPIEQIQIDDYVLTRNGYQRVIASGLTEQDAEVYTVHFSNGATLTGTGNHPIYLSGQGYIPLRALRYGDIIEDIKPYSEQYTERYPLSCQSLQQKKSKPWSTKVSSLGAIPSRLIGQMPTTTDPTPFTSWQALRRYTLKSGKMPMGQCLKGVTFITKTPIRAITRWITWNASRQQNTLNTMLNICQKSDWSDQGQTWIDCALLRRHGTNQKLVGRGIAFLALCRGIMQNIETTPVSSVENYINLESYRKIIAAFAPITVSQHGGVMLDSTMKHASVSNAVKSSFATSTLSKHSAHERAKHWHGFQTLLRKQGFVQYAGEHLQRDEVATRNTAHEPAQAVAVCSISKNEALQAVYNLTVENTVGEGEYFANGILVHNCDALRYLVARFDLRPTDVRYSNRIY